MRSFLTFLCLISPVRAQNQWHTVTIKFAALLIVTLCAAVTFPQCASAQTSTPDAYVYVLNRVKGSITVELDGFSADSSGALTPLPGSPFWTSTSTVASQFWTLAHTVHWLFASDAVNIYTFSIAWNGALTLKSSINAQQFANSPSDEITSLVLDRRMATLYATEYNVGFGTFSILAFNKNGTTGALTFLGSTDYPRQALTSRLVFSGNNDYAYSAGCDVGASWFAAHRNSDGTLDSFPINPPIPSNPNGNYCPFGAAADPTSLNPSNILAVSLFLGQSGPTQLAIYTADSSGNLTTNSTAANMPTTVVGVPNRMAMYGRELLAVGGPSGLQVFHFNFTNPITAYTKRLAWTNYDLAWDKHKHLYAIENGGVHAWRITLTSWKQASPYPLDNPLALAVLSKP